MPLTFFLVVGVVILLIVFLLAFLYFAGKEPATVPEPQAPAGRIASCERVANYVNHGSGIVVDGLLLCYPDRSNEVIEVDDMLAEFERLGLRPVNIDELYEFLKEKWPIACKIDIAALGTVQQTARIPYGHMKHNPSDCFPACPTTRDTRDRYPGVCPINVDFVGAWSTKRTAFLAARK